MSPPEAQFAVRLDASVHWTIFRSGGKVMGIVKPTAEELARIHAVWDRNRPGEEPREDGYLSAKVCYRNELDEAAVLARWSATRGAK